MSDSAKFANILNESNDLLQQEGKDESPQDRLTMLADASNASLAPMQAMLRGTEVRGMTIGDSRFEEEYFVNSLPFVMRMRIKDKIFKVLESAGENYRDVQLNGSGTFTKIEKELYSEKLTGTLDAIERQKSNSKASLAVAEGMSTALKTSTDTVLADWKVQEKDAIDFLDNRDVFYKIAGLRRKARFEKYSEKFKKNIAEKRDQIQASINMVKNRKTNDINQAKTRIESSLSVAKNGNAQQRKDRWDFVKAVVANPSLATYGVPPVAVESFIDTNFGIGDKSDFLEALVALGYTEKADAGNVTAGLSDDTDKLIEGFSDEEDDFVKVLDPTTTEGTPHATAVEAVKTALGAAVSPSKEKDIALPTLIADLEKTIKSKESNFVSAVYGGVGYGTPQQKLWKIMCYLSATIPIAPAPATGAPPVIPTGTFIKSLDRTTLQKFLKYLNDVDKDTKLNVDSENFEQQAQDCIDDTIYKTEDFWGTWPTLMGGALPNPANPTSATIFEQRISAITPFIAGCRKNFDIFTKKVKPSLTVEKQAQFDQRWADINKFVDELQSKKDKWRKQWDHYQEWQREHANWDAQRQNFTDILNDTSQDAAGRTRADAGLKRIEQNFKRVLEFGGQEATGPCSVFVDELAALQSVAVGAGATSSEADLTQDGRINGPSITATDFETRFRSSLKEKFHDEQEAQLAQNLKENTTSQWDILQKRPEGEFVKIRYYNTLGIDTLPSAKHLATISAADSEFVDLKIISKTKSGVVLQNTADSKTFVLSGPTEKKDGKWSPNLGVFNQIGAAIQPNNAKTMGVILNINLGA